MKNLTAALTLLLATTAFASGIPDSTLREIGQYHAQNQAHVAKYKILNGGAMNHFLAVIELDCNNGEFADWRIKQYDESYKACEKETLKLAYERAGLDYSSVPKTDDAGEYLKAALAKKNGIKTHRKYNIEEIDINDEKLSVDQLRDLANELTRLVSRD